MKVTSIKIKVVLALSLFGLLTGCGAKADTEKKIDETLTNMEFTSKSKDVKQGDGLYKYVLSTESKTISQYGVDVTINHATTNKDTITYDVTDIGGMDNINVYLSPDGMRKYSKAYTDEYGKIMTVEQAIKTDK